MNGFFGNTISMSTKALDFLWAKQNITLNNIANDDTPGYKARYATFEEAFRRRLAAASAQGPSQVSHAIQEARWQVHRTTRESARADGNNVNTDAESVELARTALQYQHIINAINSDIARLRGVIKG